jgi:hypothetical protein
MPEPARTGILFYAKDLLVVSTFYEKVYFSIHFT